MVQKIDGNSSLKLLPGEEPPFEAIAGLVEMRQTTNLEPMLVIINHINGYRYKIVFTSPSWKIMLMKVGDPPSWRPAGHPLEGAGCAGWE